MGNSLSNNEKKCKKEFTHFLLQLSETALLRDGDWKTVRSDSKSDGNSNRGTFRTCNRIIGIIRVDYLSGNFFKWKSAKLCPQYFW